MSANTAQPANPRQPLSLRELFCLTTLAAITVALVLYREWSTEERWLLGLTLGGTLLGILVARLFGRRVWIAGALAGTVGSVGAVAVLGQEWYRQYSTEINPPYPLDALQTLELRWQYLTTGAVTLLLGYLLALLTVGCYRLADRATDSGERGLIRTARKHPLRIAVVLFALALAIIAIWRIDFLLQPSAWSPRQCIKLQRPERAMISGVGNPEAQVRLSHDGKWLAFSVFDLRLKGETYFVQLVQLEPQARPIALPPINAANSWRSLPEFSCDEARCAYLVYSNLSAGAFPSHDTEVHVLDLTTNKDELLEDPGNNVTWLPGRKLVVDVRVLSRATDGWSAEEIEDLPEYHPRLGYAIYRERESVRVVELASSREIAVLPGPGGWPAHHSNETYSPNGRFGLIYNEIYDHQLNTTRAWEYDDEQTLVFHTFTRNGYAVAVRNDWTAGLPVQLPWLWRVPLANRLVAWLWREPICLIDPATGEEVARTRPLWSPPDDIAFSFDGSRMAVINLEGVYIYDVPAEFR